MKILHFSDTHLGYANFDKVNEFGVNVREQDFYDAFEYVFNKIIEIKPDIIIHSGDFFNKPSPTNRAMTFVLEQFKRISNLDIPFIVIAGNHSTPKTIYTSPILKAFKTIKNVYPIFNQSYEYFEFNNIVIHGLPHINDPLVQQEELARLKIAPNKRNILMLHTSLGKNYLMDEYGEQLFPEEKLNLMKEFDFIALGHWHNFQKVTVLDNAWYSGSTERMSDSEINYDKGFCILNIIDNERITPVFHKIPTRNWLKIDIRNCFEKTIDEILNELKYFIESNTIEESIINLNFHDILTGQTIELSNTKLKEILATAFSVSIKRKTYQENSFFSEIESGSFDKLNLVLADFIRAKYPNKEQSDILIERSNFYFNKEEQ